jgi:hypothetical protein
VRPVGAHKYGAVLGNACREEFVRNQLGDGISGSGARKILERDA